MAVTLTEMNVYKRLVAAGNSKIYYEGIGVSVGRWTELTTTGLAIDTTDQLQMFEAFQKVFVVNGASGTKLCVADFINTKISTSDIRPDDVNNTAPIKGTVLTGGTSTATMIVDYVTANNGAADIYGYVTSGTISATAELMTGTNASGTPTAVSFNKTAVAAVAKPHWYAWTVYPAAGGLSFGTMPAKAYLGCLYRGRAVLSGNPNAPNQWYMSRIANLYDWNYSATDAMGAVAGNNADAGELGDIVRALAPYKDDILIFGCASSMWYLRGDPMSGGSIDSFSETIGIFGAKSWCIDNEGNFYFWGSGGIYVSSIEGGTITKPKCISGVVLPDIIKDTAADPTTHRICMGYDSKRLGLVITITLLADGTSQNYWYDLRTEGFFPESYPTASGAYSIFNYQANSDTYSGLLLGCKDGYVRKFNDSLEGDNATADAVGAGTTAISSYVGIVQPLGDNEDAEGRLNSLTITTAGGASSGAFSDTDNVNYELHRGNNAETVLEDMTDGATAQETGSITTTGRQNRIRKRLKGAYLGIKLYNSTVSKTWAIEKINAEVQPCGKIK